MEVKSNVRQRRMDRMKQIVASEQPTASRGSGRGGPVSGNDRPYGDVRPIRPGPGSEADDAGAGYRDDRLDDPEYVWNRQQQKRWDSWNGPGGARRSAYDDGGYGAGGGLKPPSVRQIWVKLGISALLFGGVWGLFRLDHPMAERGQAWVRSALTEEYDFSTVAAWYDRTFGGVPAFLPSLRPSPEEEARKASSSTLQRLYPPVHGKIVEVSKTGDLGITIRTEPEAPIAALDTGRVIAISTDTDKGTVIVVQHTGGLQSTYGWVTGTALKKHDWVKGGETIGTVTTDAAGGAGKLFVAVKKDGQYVNPTEVVSFD